MFDVRELAPAAWGLAGALAYGFYMVIQAFRVPGASPGARGKALADLALGVFVGPMGATIFTNGVLFYVPRFDARAVAVTLGVASVPGFPAIVRWVVSLIPKPKDGGGA